MGVEREYTHTHTQINILSYNSAMIPLFIKKTMLYYSWMYGLELQTPTLEKRLSTEKTGNETRR